MQQLWALWRDGYRADSVRHALAMPVPGRLSLRCRYEALCEGNTIGRPASEFDITEQLWREQITLFDAGDMALRRNDTDSATAAFDRLVRSQREGHHPITGIDGRIGLADAHRQAERVDEAVDLYAAALAEASSCGYGYGQVRAGIPLGYLHLRSGSAARAAREFETASRVALDNDWRLEIANALTGLGEALQRLRNATGSMKALLAALTIFEALSSDEGVVNATVQLGELCRRNRWLAEAAGWYGQAIDIARPRSMSIALTNALDGLAEVQLAQGDRLSAIRNHFAAYRVAGPGNPRGRAHAVNGLARCAVNARRYETAIKFFSQGLQLYLSIDDLTAAATSETGIAHCREALGDLEAAVQHRVSAVTLVEAMRAAQLQHAHQAEYFDRFGTAHEMAVRTALRAGDAAAFVAVFESMAGRRLAGLMTSVPESATAAEQLAESVAKANDQAGQRRTRTRTLDGLALGEPRSDQANQSFDDTVSGLYSAFDPTETENLWAQTDTGDAHLLLIVALRDPDELAWLLRPARGQLHIGLQDLPSATREVIDALHTDGLPLNTGPEFVAPLGELIPSAVLDVIAPDEPIVVVPLGRLWAVPWTAIPLPDATYLGERNPVSVSPSLTSVAHTSGGARQPAGTRIAYWESPTVDHHRVVAYHGRDDLSVERVADAAACRSAILEARTDLVVVVAHGRPVRALVHYLELDEHVALTPADMLDAAPPPTIILISCWGAHAPGRVSGDPMTIATLALARGVRAIAATTSEMLDDPSSSAFVNQFLSAATVHPLPQALHIATRRWLARPANREGFLSRWAPLITLGAW
ncbi:tetratricopeptide repeat protein [Nocardia rhizosphaerihabitans]|nr:CHAT domain-containing protein [Nocardia rhizosphaerihabitans]